MLLYIRTCIIYKSLCDTGLLSKSKGQILRVSATLHVLFHINSPLAISEELSDEAIRAAINLVDVCIQHAAFLAGRGDVGDKIEELAKGTCTYMYTAHISTIMANYMYACKQVLISIQLFS